MSDITTGTIYKIICRLDHKFVYIGSTFDTLRNRWQRHKRHYSDWIKDSDTGKCACAPYFKKYGIDNFKILEIRKYDIHMKDRKCLFAYEMLWISKTRGCCNKILPIQYFKKEARKGYYRNYCNNNQEKILKNSANYRANNKDRIKESNKKWYDNHREEILRKDRVKYQNNLEKERERSRIKSQKDREKNSEKLKCACGSEVTKHHMSRHYKSKTHMDFLARGCIVKKVDTVERKKQRYEANKIEIAEKKKIKVTCQCGSTLRKEDMARHCKTAKHQAYLATQTE